MSLAGLDIRPFGPGDDIEAELDLRRRAFGPFSAASRPRWLDLLAACIDAGQMVGVFDGGRLIASARYHAMRQWWHGRSMPMAGVAGVKVAPEERGRGVGSAMMARLLAEIAAGGYPVSALYPTTAQVYRSAGWEFAGAKYEAVLPAWSLASLAAPDEAAARAGGAVVAVGPAPAPKLRRATAADAEAIIDVKGRVHAELRDCGPNTREPASLHRLLADEDHFAYLAEDGFLGYRWADDGDEIEVEELVAASAPTARAFWQILASHGAVAGRVRACLGPDDPVSWLTKEPAAALHRRASWMFRLVDAPAAIAARGYPPSVSLSALLDITDPALPGNAGRWVLVVSDGAGRLARAAADGIQEGNGVARGAGQVLRLGPRGFAAMYAGVPLATLRLAGLADGGDPAADASLDSAFAGRAFMIDYF
ncbi:MAG: enhanced intracellular survival protein Eis [Streptosporangiaceae bacterium]